MPQSTESRWRRNIQRRIEVAGLAISLVSVIGFLARAHWLADLLSQFRVQYAVLLFVLTVALLFFRRWKSVFILSVFLMINSWPLIPYLATRSAAKPDNSLRVLTTNVLSTNQQKRKLVAAISRSDADIVLMFEVTPEMAELGQGLAQDYPHQHFDPRPDNFGIGVLSRIPFDRIDVVKAGPAERPSYDIDFTYGANSIHLIATHPLPPLGRIFTRLRDDQLMLMAARFGESNHRIMVGDFNLTPWSPKFQEILNRAKLKDSGLGFGLQPTWNIFPTSLGGVRIDHVLVSPEFEVLRHQVSENPGSDHRAILVDLRIPAH